MNYNNKNKLKDELNLLRASGYSIGFVPTMGALHQGHISLMELALQSCDQVVVSIYVNPTQFDNSEDLAKYPNQLDQDLSLIKASFSDDQIIVYTPLTQDIYGDEPQSKHYDFGDLGLQMEGAQRPGHFDGVGTILEYFFELIQPDMAFFGEKDFQQLLIVRELVRQLELSVKIVGCPIARDSVGLALSSRNARLSEQGKITATAINKSLHVMKEGFLTATIDELLATAREFLDHTTGIETEYVSIVDEQTLRPVSSKAPGLPIRAFVVAHIEGVRLIDNMKLN
ncbi:MAG: pantoate--beta-alanine ligase [Nonlabens sp.]